MKKIFFLLSLMMSFHANANNIDQVNCSEIFYAGNTSIAVSILENSFVISQQVYVNGRQMDEIVAEGQIGSVSDAEDDTIRIELLENSENVGTLIVRSLKDKWRLSSLQYKENTAGKGMLCSIVKK